MIEVSRPLVRQFRVLHRKLFGRSHNSVVQFIAGKDGLVIRAVNGDAALEYREPGEHQAADISVPLDLLADCEGRKEEPVVIEPDGETHVIARWKDGSIPQIVRHPAMEAPGKFPAQPGAWAANDPGILEALKEACDTADPESTRYALGCLQLCGAEGEIRAADGRHLLIQGGFSFPWTERLLMPCSNIFAAKELANHEEVRIGKNDDWVCLSFGPWNIYRFIDQKGRFPNLDGFIKPADEATSRLQFDSADAKFLNDNIRRLPVASETTEPITLDLNGEVVIRGEEEGRKSATELILTNSTRNGAATQLTTNRRYLDRALRMGFRELCIYDQEIFVACYDENRAYAWALLQDDGPQANKKRSSEPEPEPTRIESPPSEKPRPETTDSTTPETKRRKTSMPKQATTTNGSSSNGHAQETENIEAVIEQAEGLKTTLRDVASQAGELIAALKRQRKTNRLVKNTLQSLRQLQAIDA